MAEVFVSSMFSDNMVLQREKPVCVWGTGEPGAKLTIEIEKQKKSTVVDKDGSWSIYLDPMPAGGPYELIIKSDETVVKFKNVMIGEVWLCSGQSNMQWRTADVANAEEEIQRAGAYPDIRLYLVPKFGADKPKKTLDARWQVCSPESVADFSAVAYFFARELRKSPALRDVPIGLIDSSYGGTLVEAWMSSEVLHSRFPNEDLRDSLFGWKPSSMYNGMIAPLVPYQIRGFLWYQGESNAGRPEQYERLFPEMIKHWRELWGQPDLPFLFVQLPNYAEKVDGKYYTWLREVQYKVAQKVPNTAMAVTIDVGDPYDIHPKNKQDVGYRLALLALNKVYGEDVPCYGPTYKSHKIEGSVVRVTFDHVEEGLVNKNRGPLRGFAIAGEDGIFWYANATIEGNQVVLSSRYVPSPRYVRYAWEGNPNADLYNTAGLPAVPFRTDNFPSEDYEIYLIPASRSVSTSFYEALVDGNSWLLSLKVRGEEFLESIHTSGIPGGFFHTFWGPARLVHISHLGPHQLYCEIETASILYEFYEDRLSLTMHNRTEQDLSYFLIFSHKVKAVKTEDNKIRPLPIQGEQEDTTWFSPNGALYINCKGILRFPFDKNVDNQALEIRLRPKEKKQLQLQVREITQSEREKIESLSK